MRLEERNTDKNTGRWLQTLLAYLRHPYPSPVTPAERVFRGFLQKGTNQGGSPKGQSLGSSLPW